MAKCARPGCEKEARTEKPNSCCSNACNSAMSRGEVVVTKICALPGCGKLARSNRPNAACCKSHSRLYYNLCHPERIEAFNQLKREIRKQQKINKEAEKVCVCGCNETFVPTSNSQKYKNKTHANRVMGRRKYEREKSERKKSERKKSEVSYEARNCIECGSRFVPTSRKTIKYCSRVCSNKVSNRKHKANKLKNKAKIGIEQMVYAPAEGKKQAILGEYVETITDKPEYEKLDAKFSEMKNWMKAEKGSFQAHLIKKRGEKFLITACKVALNSTLAVSASITATRCFECMERG